MFVLLALAAPWTFSAPAEEPPRDDLSDQLHLTAIPLGLPAFPDPQAWPVAKDRAELGRRLFFDPLLSADGTLACASCHPPERGFSHGAPKGIKGQGLRRRAPTLFNRAYGQAFFWDGRAASLEEQALKPIEDPQELGSTVAETLRRLRSHPDYLLRFQKAFADGITAANLAKALADFQRGLLRGNSPVDRFLHEHDHDALTAPQRHGMWIFDSKGQCWKCHPAPHYTDEKFHNTGVSWGRTPLDLGRYEATRRDADKGRFKTPTLRGVRLTAPYMHDGSIKTLEEVIDLYDRGGNPNPHLDPLLHPLKLNPEEKRNLVEFLKVL